MARAKLAVASLCLFVVLTQHEAAAAAASRSCHGGRAMSMVEAMFVFGSSLVDNGNNNFLNGSRAVRADYLPYGVDFPLGPTGRFSNGRYTIDALGELLRLPAGGRIPTFADPATRAAPRLHGVNFASGGSGILDRTGKDNAFLRNCSGCTLWGRGSSSSSPSAHRVRPRGEGVAQPVTAAACVKPVNAAALLFNSELRSLVDAAGPRMPGASFSMVDSYKITMDVLDHPRGNTV
ncbi:hypothetical protein ACQ4PT_053599 [Festuca glaucescens]